MSSLRASEANIVNAALCGLCRKVVEHAAQINPGPSLGGMAERKSELLFTNNELLEKTMSEKCALCRLFWSMLTTAEKNEMRDLKFSEEGDLSDSHGRLSVDRFEAAYEVYYGWFGSKIFEFEFCYSSSSVRYSSLHNSIRIMITLSPSIGDDPVRVEHNHY